MKKCKKCQNKGFYPKKDADKWWEICDCNEGKFLREEMERETNNVEFVKNLTNKK